MTRIVLALDSFKGSITAADASAALTAGIHGVDPSIDVVPRPMADGGEGTVSAFASAVPDARLIPVTVDGPAGRRVETSWLLLPATPDAPAGTAVIDLASTSGIELLDELRPWDADTTGFGQAIAAALDHGVSRLVLGIGSSASTDGGTGLLAALGAQFLDVEGQPIARGARGLADLARVDLSGLRSPIEVLVLTDVLSPLVGPAGAAAVFGPQKGLSDAADIAAVDAALVRLAKLLGVEPATPRTGAAGGAGLALHAWGAQLVSGAPEVAALIRLDEAIAEADLVVTGEGSFDGQSSEGKVPSLVAERAQAHGVPVALVAGRIAESADATGFTSVVSLTVLAGSSDAAMADPAHYLHEAGEILARQHLAR
ncbi:glycerate kinase [Microbacterium keratanolyticum]|uniref:Glycerate kinase n=1 Tax=Microbacterium keratanolyticum TaxID=67574 RepID=A0A9W6HR49_9MICO|nr:glycerate kinase [Microbacterium keratanolyticum]MBM7469268.1 glycerate kinase [Microbacterium keratanolyticum]GLK01348.1 glycerate kinase [Microbacterium keratanolyticum]